MKKFIKYYFSLFICTLAYLLAWCIIAPELFEANSFMLKYGHYVFILVLSGITALYFIKKFELVIAKKNKKKIVLHSSLLVVTGICVSFFGSLFLLFLVFLYEAMLFA